MRVIYSLPDDEVNAARLGIVDLSFLLDLVLKARVQLLG
jgi:hypothetical protein